jgi:hypothetical protein
MVHATPTVRAEWFVRSTESPRFGYFLRRAALPISKPLEIGTPNKPL